MKDITQHIAFKILVVSFGLGVGFAVAFMILKGLWMAMVWLWNLI